MKNRASGNRSAGRGARTSLFCYGALVLFAVCAAVWAGWPHRLAIAMTDESGALVYVRAVAPGETFVIDFVHSVHRTPVRETYRVAEGGGFVLERVAYESFGVGNPSAPEPGQTFRIVDGTYTIDGLERRLPSIRLRVGRKAADHHIAFGGERIPLTRWVEPGSRLEIAAKPVSPWTLWTT